MKYIILLLLPVLSACSQSKDYVLPAKWEKDFKIHVYQGGGMNYESTNIWFRKDSCIYVEMENGRDSVMYFMPDDKILTEIIDSLRVFDVERMKTKSTGGIAHDMETTSICFDKKGSEYCINVGATENVGEKYGRKFFDAFYYLKRKAAGRAKFLRVRNRRVN